MQEWVTTTLLRIGRKGSTTRKAMCIWHVKIIQAPVSRILRPGSTGSNVCCSKRSSPLASSTTWNTSGDTGVGDSMKGAQPRTTTPDN